MPQAPVRWAFDTNAATTISLCRRENFPRALYDHLGPDLLHAGVIERALAEATVITGRTRQVDAHNRFRPFVRADVNRIRRAKYAHHGLPERCGHVHRPRVVRHRHFSALDEPRQICWSSFTAKIGRSRRGSGDLLATRLIAFRTRESNSKSFAKKLARDACKSFDGPVLCFPNRPGHKNNKRFASWHAVLIEAIGRRCGLFPVRGGLPGPAVHHRNQATIRPTGNDQSREHRA